jgi:hypothetical protein
MEKEMIQIVKPNGKMVMAPAYNFSAQAQKCIAKSLAQECRKLEKKIESIKNHPKNEGQVKYQTMIDQVQYELDELKAIINEFKNA